MVRGHPGEQTQFTSTTFCMVHIKIGVDQPRWRNGSVFLLHGNGSSSILLRGTKGVANVVRIRQPDCKFGPHGSGSSPLLPTNSL